MGHSSGTRRQALCCWFCGKGEHEVEKLLAGAAGGLICDSCVAACVDILGRDGRAPGGLQVAWRRMVARVQSRFGGGNSKLIEVSQ
jgi:hypothetical protein